MKASPRIRFNKNGTLLAVSANENGIKILSNADNFRGLRPFDNLAFDAPRTSEGVKVLFQLLVFFARHLSNSIIVREWDRMTEEKTGKKTTEGFCIFITYSPV